MINQVALYIQKNNLIDKNKKVVVALSGGVDSMSLLDILTKLGYSTVIAHVNHNVRTQSKDEMEYIKEFALKNNIPFECIILDKIENENFHEKARNLRYQFFMDVAKKYNTDTIATAHHADDFVETILMKITRGSNLYGYSGINKKTINNTYNIVRPLLFLKKDDLYNYAKMNNVTFFEDSSNFTDHYTRNRYRHHIIPLLKEENPNIYDSYNAFSNQVLTAFNYIRKQTLKIKDISVSDFNLLDDALKNDYICLKLEENKLETNYNKIQMINDFLSKNLANGLLELGNNIILKTQYNNFSFVPKKEKKDFSYQIDDFGLYEFENFSIYLTKNNQKTEDNLLKICYNDLVLPIVVRNRKNGDTLNMPFGQKKLKDFFIDKKIPMELRDTLPVVVNGNGVILGVPGILNTKFNIANPVYLVYKKREVVKNE